MGCFGLPSRELPIGWVDPIWPGTSFPPSPLIGAFVGITISLFPSLHLFDVVYQGILGSRVYRNICASCQFQKTQCVRYLLVAPLITGDHADAQQLHAFGLKQD